MGEGHPPSPSPPPSVPTLGKQAARLVVAKAAVVQAAREMEVAQAARAVAQAVRVAGKAAREAEPIAFGASEKKAMVRRKGSK